MAKVKPSSSKDTQKKMRPALTPEARENQLISLAVDLVEKRLIEGTASSQETTHFLKLGSTKSKYELEKLKAENELIKAKAELAKSQKNSEEMFKKAIEAMKSYSGSMDINDDCDGDYDEY